jgi:hypothetical protein
MDLSSFLAGISDLFSVSNIVDTLEPVAQWRWLFALIVQVSWFFACARLINRFFKFGSGGDEE